MSVRDLYRPAAFAAALTALLPVPAGASYGFYVGRNLTEDGSVLLGGTGEEVSSHWLEIVPRRSHPAGATVTVGVTEDASIPGELTPIPQVPETFKYITMNYSDYEGFPAPLTNGGMNEHQVAIRDIWAPSRDELVERTPVPQRGPQYSDLARLALERARTAREAVEIIGRLIDAHGYSTYGGNSHLIADPNEAWVVLEFAGGEGLWVAERLGPDEVKVLYPGYIEEIPKDYQNSPDHMGSANLIPFAVEQGWYDPAASETFDVHAVYGAQGVPARNPGSKFVSQAELEQELLDKAPVSVDEMMALVRDPRIADDEAGYGQVAHLRRDLPHPGLALLWVAPTGSVTTPFVPWRIGVTDVPPEFGQHRYLTKDAPSTFLDPEFQLQEATTFAGRVFKRLMYYTCAHPEVLLPQVRETIEAHEATLQEEQPTVEATARVLYEADPELAATYLTFYSDTQAANALAMGEALLAGVEAQVKARFGIPLPAEGALINSEGGETVNCLEGADPDRPPS